MSYTLIYSWASLFKHHGQTYNPYLLHNFGLPFFFGYGNQHNFGCNICRYLVYCMIKPYRRGVKKKTIRSILICAWEEIPRKQGEGWKKGSLSFGISLYILMSTEDLPVGNWDCFPSGNLSATPVVIPSLATAESLMKDHTGEKPPQWQTIPLIRPPFLKPFPYCFHENRQISDQGSLIA